MFFDDDEMSAGETAASYTNEFLDAAVTKIDSVFGAGHAQKNPALVAGYIQASATNLNAFMTAAANMQPDGLAEAFAAAMEEMEFDDDDIAAVTPPAKPRRKGRK
ncbi:MAG: hypothetical protein H5U15_11325 [Roseovarius sp.]|jgi:roadblock/LC7 domain-containing protein|nr:hypothetical protein [Roseovarius sp.]